MNGIKNTRDDTPSVEEAKAFLTEAEKLNPGVAGYLIRFMWVKRRS